MLLALSIIGIVLSAVLLYFSVRNNKSNIYLGLFFLFLSLYSFSQFALLHSKSVFLVVFFIHFVFLFYLPGPLLYWYVRGLLNDSAKFKAKDLIHLVPALIHFVFSIPLLISPLSYKTGIAESVINDYNFLEHYKFTALSGIFSVHSLYLSRPLLLLFYAIGTAVVFVNYLRNKNGELVFKNQRFMNKWLSVFLCFLLLLVTSHLLLMRGPVSDFLTLNILQIISGIGMLGLLLSPFFFPEILYGLPRFPQNDPGKLSGSNASAVVIESQKNPYDFEADYLLLIEEKVDSYMLDFKPFLQQDLNLIQFSVFLNIPVHHLTYYFREVKKQSFINYRNSCRIDHAKTLIQEGKTSELTIEAIGLLSGFTTRNSFFTAFKKSEGISPGAYANRNNKPDLN